MLTTNAGERGIATACVELRAGVADGVDFFTSLGKPFVVQFGGPYGSGDQFVMLLAESAQPVVCSRVLTETLLKQYLLPASGRWIEHDPSPIPWLAAPAATRLSRAFCAIFEQTGVAYTVDSLALIAGMSRSAFATAFRHAFGQSPTRVVKPVRLRRASERFVTTVFPVAEVAKRVEFSGCSNYSGAFSELPGTDPSCSHCRFSLIEEGLRIR